ncbi:hypothetical protein [Streptomyces virginiae]|uniref:hypothetical protein n=1 Tax=Streptomyces virginiae TaxID=1961 RepID=UPI0004CB85B9
MEGWFEREAGARGYAPAVLEEVWEIIKGFGAYGFCRAHDLVSDARRHGVPVLQVDVNRSAADHRIEQTRAGVWGVRHSRGT